ncbi:GTPase [Candidatus Vidania fulgoroideorum]
MYTRRPIIGIIGEVDHGKTSLFKILTGINNIYEDGDITVNKRLAPSVCNAFLLLDSPGHQDFLFVRKNIIDISDYLIIVLNKTIAQSTIDDYNRIVHDNKPVIFAINKSEQIDNKEEYIRSLTSVFHGDFVHSFISCHRMSGIPDLLKNIAFVQSLNPTYYNESDEYYGYVIDSTPSLYMKYNTTIVMINGIIRLHDTIICKRVTYNILHINQDGKKIPFGIPSTILVIPGISLPNGSKFYIMNQHLRACHKPLLSYKNNTPPSDYTIYSSSFSIKTFVIKALSTMDINVIEKFYSHHKHLHILKIIYLGIGKILPSDMLFASNIRAKLFFIGLPDKYMGKQYTIFSNVSRFLHFLSNECSQCIIEKLYKYKKIIILGCTTIYGAFSLGDAVCFIRHNVRIGQGIILSLRHNDRDISHTQDLSCFAMTTSANIGFIKKDLCIKY